MSRYFLPIALVIAVIGPVRSQNLFAPGECLMLPSPGDITALADFDKDGDLDAVVFTSAASLGYVLMNDGAGQFTLVAGLVSGPTPRQALTGDVDGDGNADVVTRNASTVTVFWNNITSVTTQTVPAPAGLGDLELVDFGNDGDLDLWFTSGNLIVNNAGSFGAPETILPGPDITEIHAVDIDADSDAGASGRSPGPPSPRRAPQLTRGSRR